MTTWLTGTQRNLLANFAGQSSNAVLTFLFIPWYIHYLGMEAYGVVGFALALQAALAIFDLGLSMTANRELAMHSAHPGTANEMRALVRSLQWVSWLMAGALGTLLFLLAPLLAERWLHPQKLQVEEIALALQLMALAIALQWPAVFYAGCLSGLQQQTTLNLIQLGAALLRFPGIVLLLAFGSNTLTMFFLGQIGVSAVQTLATGCVLWRSLPAFDPAAPSAPPGWQRLGRFAVAMTGISATALIVTQLDKLLLSRYLPLEQFAYYVLASTFVGSLSIVAMPVYAAMFPRFAQLVAAGAHAELRTLYHQAAQFLSALLFPISGVLVVFPEAALLVWTNDAPAAHSAKTILRLLALGSTVNCLLLIPYALQLAHGWTRLALSINVGVLCVFVPLILFLAPRYGGEGTALAWLVVNILYLLVAVPLMHRRLLPGDLWRWCGADVLLPLLSALAVYGVLALFVETWGRWESALLLTGALLAGFAGSMLTVPLTRAWMWQALRRAI